MKKKPDPKVTYVYNEPKTEEERMIQESNVSRAYDILFEATYERLEKEGRIKDGHILPPVSE